MFVKRRASATETKTVLNSTLTGYYSTPIVGQEGKKENFASVVITYGLSVAKQ